MKLRRVVPRLVLIVLFLGGAAWQPASRSIAVSGEAPAGLSTLDWRAIQVQLAKFTAADGEHIGSSVSVDGDTAVVGDLFANSYQGAVYIFYRNQGGPQAWGQVAKLTVTDGGYEPCFGMFTALSGDTVLVGAPEATVGGNWLQGAAYVFYRNQGGPDAWGQVAKLTAADGVGGDSFGYVSLGGDTAVIGAPYAEVGGNGSQGAAYVFYRDQGGPDAWGQIAKLIAADGAEMDGFGQSAVSGDTAIVGAYSAAPGGNDGQGAAYVFNRDQGGPDAWGQTAKLTALDGQSRDYFGISVSLSDDTAVVGAHANIGGNLYQGAAYVFQRDQGGPGAWGQVAKLTAPDGAAGDRFGDHLSLGGDTAIVGARYASVGGNLSQGAAYAFYRNAGGPDAWGLVEKLTAGDGATDDNFGNPSISGDTAIVLAPGADIDGNVDQGAAYVFAPLTLHLSALQLAWSNGLEPGTYTVRAVVRIHDGSHAAAPDVTVLGEWSAPNGTSRDQTRATNANGAARFGVQTRRAGTWSFCVIDVSKAGFLYDSSANEKPSCRTVSVGQ